MQHFNTGQGAAGMQKYLLRQQQAKEKKMEQEERAKKVFGSGKNWKPTTTVPKAPNISSNPARGDRSNFKNEIKSLSKPVGGSRMPKQQPQASYQQD